jgi:hypothetical protein
LTKYSPGLVRTSPPNGRPPPLTEVRGNRERSVSESYFFVDLSCFVEDFFLLFRAAGRASVFTMVCCPEVLSQPTTSVAVSGRFGELIRTFCAMNTPRRIRIITFQMADFNRSSSSRYDRIPLAAHSVASNRVMERRDGLFLSVRNAVIAIYASPEM